MERIEIDRSTIIHHLQASRQFTESVDYYFRYRSLLWKAIVAHIEKAPILGCAFFEKTRKCVRHRGSSSVNLISSHSYYYDEQVLMFKFRVEFYDSSEPDHDPHFDGPADNTHSKEYTLSFPVTLETDFSQSAFDKHTAKILAEREEGDQRLFKVFANTNRFDKTKIMEALYKDPDYRERTLKFLKHFEDMKNTIEGNKK